jgi:molecular chaperone DnaK (HSP70)
MSSQNHAKDLTSLFSDIHLKEAGAKLIIAIDFGTTYSGVAYAHSSINKPKDNDMSPERFRDKIIAVKKWPNVSQVYSEKTPTVLAYQNGKLIAWGGKVRHSHSTQISHFKLGLQDDVINNFFTRTPFEATALGGFLSSSNWRHPDLLEKHPVDFATDYIRELRKYILEVVLPQEFGKEFLANQLIKYVLTVPAIWSDKATNLTKTAAIRAGIKEDALELVTEPEAAALYCSTLCPEVNLNKEDIFLICDAGGGTVVR